MKGAASLERMAREQDLRISEVVKREQSRLRSFIRRRVPDPRDAEDILQDVFYKLVEANRLLMPIDHATGWLFQVARNRITDLFRKKSPENFSDAPLAGEDEESLLWEDLLGDTRRVEGAAGDELTHGLSNFLTGSLALDASSIATSPLSRITIERGDDREMMTWRKRLFIGLAHNAATPAAYFCLPDDRTVVIVKATANA